MALYNKMTGLISQNDWPYLTMFISHKISHVTKYFAQNHKGFISTNTNELLRQAINMQDAY